MTPERAKQIIEIANQMNNEDLNYFITLKQADIAVWIQGNQGTELCNIDPETINLDGYGVSFSLDQLPRKA